MSSQVPEDARARLRPFGIFFERSLHDLIRGIRASKDPAAREAFIKDALADCRSEARSPDMDTKTMAVIKLTYLEMYGNDMSWASFHVLEVMSSSKFQQKRVGYLAAAQSFRANTDVLMLTTNLLKKDLGSSNALEVSTSLSAAASIVTPSLAHDLSADILKMLNHSKPYIRKKAVLAMYKVFLQYPEVLPESFPRLKDKLEDPDASVVSATVNVICELARQSKGNNENIKTYLSLAPQLYELLTTSKNNWMLIKILKLFSSLTPTEPRLKPKLLPSILQLMRSTTAMSLLYECINCIISGGMLDEDDYEVAELCVEKLRAFLEERDQNLKYVGLLALGKIVKKHPKFVSNLQDIILECIDDKDLTIRDRVLDIISGIVTENNIYEIVNKLMDQLRANMMGDDKENGTLSVNSYNSKVIFKIIDICSKDTYSLLPDFEWYTTILVELVTIGTDNVGYVIGDQLRNIAIRVKSMRETIVEASFNLLMNYQLMNKMPSIVKYVIWIVGEYSSLVKSPSYLLNHLIKSRYGEGEDSGTSFGTIETSIQSLIKLYSSHTSNNRVWSIEFHYQIIELTNSLISYLEHYSTDISYEVQERAVGFLELLKVTKEALEQLPDSSETPPLLLTLAIPSLFNSYELNPIAQNSQKKISPPDDLDLDAEIYPSYQLSDIEDDSSLEDENQFETLPDGTITSIAVDEPEPTEEELERKRLERLERQREDPFYIPISSGNQTPDFHSRSNTPISTLSNPSPFQTAQSSKYLPPPPRKAKVEIIQDEKIEGLDDDTIINPSKPKSKKPLLKIESRLTKLDLNPDTSTTTASEQNATLEVQKLRQQLLHETAPPLSNDVLVTHKKLKKKKPKASSDEPSSKKKKKKKPKSDPIT